VRNSLILLTMLSLAACGDPFADFERIDDVELAVDAAVANALPDADDVAPTDGLFARLIKREPVGPETPVVLGSKEAVEDVVTTDVDAVVSEESAAVAVLDAPEQRGVGGWLRRAAAANAKPEPETETVEAAETPIVVEKQNDEVADVDAEEAAGDLVEPEKRRGLLGLLQPVQDAPETVRTASLQSELTEAPEPTVLAEPKKRRGLFGSATREEIRSGPDARDVPFGTVLPFGEVARVCEAKTNGSLGRRLDQAPESGRGYKLYDSAPHTIGARTFYVTGFKDNCPRQFTAALAVFGAPEVHEQLRYGLPSKSYPYSTTDKAYEKVKSAVCRVGKSKPCGAKMPALERNTVFISTYEKFSDNARWADILLHDGVVVAAAIKTP
jgi:hypothetical protein